MLGQQLAPDYWKWHMDKFGSVVDRMHIEKIMNPRGSKRWQAWAAPGS